MADGFWRDKTVFITGHTGFKGGWLALWLQKLGARVVGYALPPPTTPSLFETARVAESMVSLEGDIRDFSRVQKTLGERQPEIVFHLAAQALVRYSYAQPLETYATNVLGTAHVLEAVRSVPSVRAVVVVTSDKCYENREWLWGYREDEAMGGYDPYSSSKGCAELVTAAYRRSFFNPACYAEHEVAVASARAGNVIGGGDWAADRLVPDMIRALLAGAPVRIHNPQAIRPWQHVLEPLSGYLRLAQKLYEEGVAYGEGWNFGPDSEDAKPVHWLVERLIQAWGEGASWQMDAGSQPHEAHYLKLDCAKARERLGWRPRWSLEQGLQATMAWYRAYADGVDLRAWSLQEIADYQADSGGI